MRFLIATGLSLAVLATAPLLIAESAAQEEAAKPEYVGSDTCKKCHFKEHRYWKKTVKSDTLKPLRPVTAEENKDLFDKRTAAKLDPAKDYSTDTACLPCHTIGFGLPGGYPADGKADADTMEKLGQVGCESCHGPGSLYVKHKTDEIAKDKNAKFTFEQMAEFGLIHPSADNCATCHNGKGPTAPAEPFDYEKLKDMVHSKPKK
jgi:hypothetical protein